jgi:phosphotransferase system  glucose/maltose/N-acetylglucosamine-specific IIC component
MSEENQDPTENGAHTEEVTASATSDEQMIEEQSMTPGPAAEQEPQVSLPPEARDPLNGGPLGCCLGVLIGLMISLLVAVIGRIYANPLVPIFHSALLVLILLRIAMAISGIAGAVILGYFGWKIGRRLYREYEPPVIHYRGYKRRKSKKARTRF